MLVHGAKHLQQAQRGCGIGPPQQLDNAGRQPILRVGSGGPQGAELLAGTGVALFALNTH